VPNLPNERPATPRARRLALIVEMLSKTPAVRSELVSDVQGQVTHGDYMSEVKLDLAIYRMLKDILE
jgi:hypothetical protein